MAVTKSVNDLEIGDVFAKEMRLLNRKSYEVIKINEKSVTCVDRSDKKKYKTKKNIKKFGWVYFLGTKESLKTDNQQLSI